MKKIGKIVIGGIQLKIFNLVLIVMILMAGAFAVVIIYQSANIKNLVNETNEQQKASINQISGETMDAVISSSLGQTTQLEATIVNIFLGSERGCSAAGGRRCGYAGSSDTV